ILNGSELFRDVPQEVGVARLYPRLAASPPPNKPLDVAAAEAFRHDLSVVPIKASNVITISVTNPSRQVAVQTLDAVLRKFQDRHTAAFSRNRAPPLEAQLATTREQLAAVERERAEYQNELRLFAAPEQRSELIRQRARDADTLLEAEIDRAVLTKRTAFLQTQLGREPEHVRLQTVDQDSTFTQEAERRVQALREQQQEMLVKYPPGSRLIAPTQAALAAAEQAAARAKRTSAATTGINSVAVTLRTDLYTSGASLAPLDSKIAMLKDAIAASDDKLTKLTNGEIRLLDLNRRAEQLAATTAALNQRLIDARFLDDLDRARVGSLTVIEDPDAAFKPVYPRKSLFLLAGLAIGLLFSSLLLLIALTFGNRFLVLETVERVLGAPVTGALSFVPAVRLRQIEKMAISEDGPAYPASST
ncbi:MAG: hypothetical protein JOZ17_04870, partial [Acetobacteraceae bacterium]|nr:hypothetical protein [Acetobacteraceae bacterium]